MSQYSEYEIKAAYIFNFAKFVDWPTSSYIQDTIVLGIYNYDPFGIILEKTMIGRKAKGKDWKIVRTNDINELSKCSIVFLSDIEKYEVLEILELFKSKPVITIGDEIIDFCESGGIINFTPQFSEQQFEINNNIANNKGIIISPKLLQLAKIISNNEDEF
ncbi:MAG: YfiR family protein [Salinivirgaceae bacterium]|nr:YfiR family protein [Salinivirgaceae bacterium]